MDNVRIFISHKKEDSNKALELEKYIKSKYPSYKVYVDELDNKINSYDNVTDRIVYQLRKSNHLLVIFSEHTQKSMWVPFELGIAYERDQGIGVFIWEDNYLDLNNLPEYLDEFPILKCDKNDKDECTTKDLDKYLKQIKSKSQQINESDSITYGNEQFESTASVQKSYAKEFINELKSKL